jgi:hypothetical protein
MAMKDKMELTIGICVGSSIVRWIFLLFSSLLLTPYDFVTANCHFCRTALSGDWLDVSKVCQQCASQLTPLAPVQHWS